MATVIPLKGSLAVGDKLATQVTPMAHEGNLYTSSTYKPNLRNINIGTRGRSGQRFANYNFGKKETTFGKKEFDSHTFSPRSNKF